MLLRICAVLFFVPAMACAFDAAEKNAAIARMLSANGYFVRFRDEIPKIITFLTDKDPNIPEAYLAAVKERLRDEDFAKAMAPIFGAYLTQKDVEVVNAFLSGGGGAKEAEFMVKLYVEIRDGRESVKNIGSRRDDMYLTLTPEERAQIVAFRNSQSGIRYWNALGLVEKQYLPAVRRLLGEAIEHANAVAREKGIPRPPQNIKFEVRQMKRDG